MFKKFRCGQSMFEVLLALGLFFVLIVAVTTLMSRYLSTVSRSRDLVDVALIGQESSAAIDWLSAENWLGLTDGTHGLSYSSGSYSLSGSSDLVKNKYTRIITVAPAMRDADCSLVETGGLPDPDTKLVTTTIAWPAGGLELSRSFYRYLTNWEGTGNSCVIGEAGSLMIDVSMSNIDSTKKSIVGTLITNNSLVPITIDKITLTWTVPGEIQYVKINGANVWHSTNGTGSPSGAQSSGTELDVVDVTIPPQTTYPVDVFRFDQKIDGSTVTIAIKMIDGSVRTEVKSIPFAP